MQPPSEPKSTFLTEITPWILGKQVAVYLAGHAKPITGLTICYIGPQTIVARWNSSTHLIQRANILFIRYSPDCDPCRDISHPLHTTVSKHRATPLKLEEKSPGGPGDDGADAARLRQLAAGIAAKLHTQQAPEGGNTTTPPGERRQHP